MKQFNLAFNFVIIFLSVFIFSCKKLNSGHSKPTDTTSKPKIYLPVTIHHTDASGLADVNITYVNINMIAQYTQGSNVWTFAYGADKKPSTLTLTNINGNEVAKFTLTDSLITRADITRAPLDKPNSPVPLGYAIYSYDNLNRVSTVNFYDPTDVFYAQLAFNYDTAGNITQVQQADEIGDGGNRFTYDSYDTKNGVFKNVRYLEMLLAFSSYNWLTYKANNFIQSTDVVNITTSTATYVYNTANFPVQQKITFDGGLPDNAVTYTYKTE